MKKITLIISLFILLSPVFVTAATGGVQQGGSGGVPQGGSGGSSQPISLSVPNPLGSINSLTDLIFAIVNLVIGFSYAVIAFFLILSGFKFVTAQGSEDKLKDAKSTFTYTIIGAMLIIGAQVIVNVLKDIFTQIAA